MSRNRKQLSGNERIDYNENSKRFYVIRDEGFGRQYKTARQIDSVMEVFPNISLTRKALKAYAIQTYEQFTRESEKETRNSLEQTINRNTNA